MAKIDPDFEHDVFRFLIKPMRDADDSGTLEGYTGAFQQAFEQTQADQAALLDLFNIDDAPDWALDYMLWIVGWTKELEHITEDLTATQKRKLLRLSAQMWKLKGTETGIKQAIRVFTGIDVIIWNWFYMRAIADEVITGLSGATGTDFWLVGESYGDRDEYYSIIWAVTSDATERLLIEDLVRLQRPIGEAIRINYADFVDDFHLDLVKWVSVDGVVPGVPVPAVWNADEFRMELPTDSVMEASVDGALWGDDVTYMFSFALTDPGGIVAMFFRYTGAASGYSILFTTTTSLMLRLAGPAVSIGAAVTIALLPNVNYGVEVHTSRPSPTELRIVVKLDGVLIQDVIETLAERRPPGNTRIGASSTSVGDIHIDNVLVYERPMATTLIEAT